MKGRLSLLSACLSVAFGFGAFAASAATDSQQLTLNDVVVQQTQLRGSVAAGRGAFKDLSDPQRDELIRKQDEVLALLRGLRHFDELRPDQRTVVFNNLEWIAATVARAEDERMVCEYTKVVGSNRMRSVCMTAREHREIRERTRESLRRGQMCSMSSIDCLGDNKNPGLPGR